MLVPFIIKIAWLKVNAFNHDPKAVLMNLQSVQATRKNKNKKTYAIEKK